MGPSPLERLQSERLSARSLGPATRPSGQTATENRVIEAQPSNRQPNPSAFCKTAHDSRARGRGGPKGDEEKPRQPCRRSPTPKRTGDLGRQLGQPAVSKRHPSDRVGSCLLVPRPRPPGGQRRSECHRRKRTLPRAECLPWAPLSGDGSPVQVAASKCLKTELGGLPPVQLLSSGSQREATSLLSLRGLLRPGSSGRFRATEDPCPSLTSPPHVSRSA